MKISTTKESFLNAVLLGEKIVGKKESLPVLSCVLIDVGSQCVIRATNLEAGIEIVLPCDIQEVGIVAVRANILTQTLRAISGDKVVISLEDGNLIVESRGTRTLIKAVPHEEFPKLNAAQGGDVMVSRADFLRSMHSVSYAASPSMIRPELGSVYISVSQGSVTAVATDSFRLAEKVVPTTRNKGDVDLLIPLKHAQELSHILEASSTDELHLTTNESQMSVRINGIVYTSRIIEGTFPNYKEIVPKTFETEATLIKADFAEMLRKARVFSGSDQHVGLHIYPKKKIFSATAQSADVGEMSDTLDAALKGEDLDINFHIGYLSDCLPVIESDSITLHFAGPGKPLVVRGASDTTFRYLVMPLNR